MKLSVISLASSKTSHLAVDSKNPYSLTSKRSESISCEDTGELDTGSVISKMLRTQCSETKVSLGSKEIRTLLGLEVRLHYSLVRNRGLELTSATLFFFSFLYLRCSRNGNEWRLTHRVEKLNEPRLNSKLPFCSVWTALPRSQRTLDDQ